MGNSGKSNGNSGKSNGKIWAKAMRKLGKRRHIFRAKIIAFSRISHCFCPNFLLLFPNFPLLLPEYSTAVARIFRFQIFLGGTVSPCRARLLRLWYLISYLQVISRQRLKSLYAKTDKRHFPIVFKMITILQYTQIFSY